ncbi:NADP-dependent D-sorbitol-6-phosphate dehydrogenase [Vitis vinifera]|uniref:NADP-dependent D-sorbitol-6-phosphate dehydrogenase n=1 Tax=Vitis vinifera TaxID=29760 RepID=A0A438I9M8_VITVI|nr:NADP-dependent D-sorbitol-6-phosphate dehydrogenase [Vitis vinifera]
MAITLNSGFKMPILGLGVWRMDGKDIRNLLINAVKIGYRHFDCAGPHKEKVVGLGHSYDDSIVFLKSVITWHWMEIYGVAAFQNVKTDYQNEVEVGEALAEAFQTGLVKREDLFITTKANHGHVIEACKASLKKLQLDYLDLFLIHFPIATKHTGLSSMPCVGTTGSALDEDGVLDIDTTISLETTWHAMEELVSMGLVRSIGISNYDIFLTRDCLAYSKVKPAVNQIETHPYFQRDSLVKFCQKHGICVTAHTPLGGSVSNTEWFGSVSCLDDPALKGLAEKYKKTVPQVVLRWGIQRNTVVIPKTSKLERLEENFRVLDFELAKEDMDLIGSLDRKHRTNQPAKFWGIDLYA